MEKLFITNRNGLKLSVKLTLPKDAKKLVFLEHGLSSRKEYPHMQVLEEVFAKNGYNVVNFDAANSLNESGADDKGITTTGHCEDLEDVINWAKTESFYSEPFALGGQSLGAVSVVRYAGKFSNKVKLLVAVAFPFFNGDLKSKFSERAVAILKDGYYDKFSKSTGRVHRIGKAYIDDLATFDISKEIAKITATTKIINCNQDTEKHIKNGKILFDKLKCEKELIEIDAPHDPANSPETKIIFTKAIEKILK